MDNQTQRYIRELERQIEVAMSIIKTAAPYVEFHYLRSVSKTPDNPHKNLLNLMDKFFREIIKMRNDYW